MVKGKHLQKFICSNRTCLERPRKLAKSSVLCMIALPLGLLSKARMAVLRVEVGRCLHVQHMHKRTGIVDSCTQDKTASEFFTYHIS